MDSKRLSLNREFGDIHAQDFEQVEPAALGQESDVLAKGGKGAAGEEFGDHFACPWLGWDLLSCGVAPGWDDADLRSWFRGCGAWEGGEADSLRE